MDAVADNSRRMRQAHGTAGAQSASFVLKHAWLAPLLALAAWLRLWGLSDGFLYGDEAEYAIVARGLARDLLFLAYPPIEGMGMTPFVSQPPLVLYVMALSMRILGPTDFAAILPSALFGVATVAAVYAVGQRLGGRFVGLAAAGVLAGMPFHVELSRKAMLDAGYAFFLVLTAYFLVAWLQDRRMRQAVGVGLAAGAAALSKLPGVLACVVALVVFAYALAATGARVARGDAKRGELLRDLGHGGAGAGLVAACAVAYLLLLASMNAISNLWTKLRWQMGRVGVTEAVASEIAVVERHWSWYFTDPHFSLQHKAGVLVVQVAALGLVVALAYLATRLASRPWHAVVPAFVGVLLAFFLWSERKEGFYLLPLAPFLALLVGYAGLGLREALEWSTRRLTPRAAPIALALAVALVAAPAYVAMAKSHNSYVMNNTPERFFGSGTREAAQWIQEHDPDAGQYGTLLGRFTLLWYNEQPTFHWYVSHSLIDSKIRSGAMKFVVYDDYLQLAFDRDYMNDLIERHNGVAVATFKQGWGQVTVYELNPPG